MTNIFQKYNIQVPRYTSYPTAPHFNTEIGATTYVNWLETMDEEEVSVYLHIPYCRELCWYCGCSMKVTNTDSPLQNYTTYIKKEIEMAASHLKRKPKMAHVHWGGGTPTLLSAEQFKDIWNTLTTHFDIAESLEHAVEIDPRTMTEDRVDALLACGVNRVSLGVQDFDYKVQEAINRLQPFQQVKRCVDWFSERGLTNINFDLIYGLPLQTLDTIHDTINKTVELSPSRIALFGYAHVPWMKKHQKLLEKHNLPDGDMRKKMFSFATEKLNEVGYVSLGLDHFAKQEDELFLAQKEGRLHRNFQGYTTDGINTMLSFGVSSIGCLPSGFVQNVTNTKDYTDALDKNTFPIARGVAFNKQDTLRRDLIEHIMCHYCVDVEAICQKHGVALLDLNGFLDKLEPMLEDGLATWEGTVLSIPKAYYPLVRVVASCFDEYFEQNTNTKHSQAV